MTLHPEFWWYATRATGITAWVAALVASVIGLALATRTLGRKPTGPWLLDLHRALSAVTVVGTALHLVALVADSYLHFGPADLFVPLASEWRPLAVAGGVVAVWLYAAVVGSSLLKDRIPKRWWRRIHLTSYLAAVTATAHAFTAGTDATNPGMVAVAFSAVVAVCFMALYRRFAPARPARVIPSRRTVPSA